MINPANRRSATVAIGRLGKECVITEPTGDSTDDSYGKTTGESWSTVGTENVARSYGSGASEPAASRETGGRLPSDSPRLIFTHDSAVQAGFRVTYLNETYEIDSLTRYDTHIEATTTLVN